MNDYDTQLRDILDKVIGLRDDRHGYTDAELDDAQQRLGFVLPHPLRFMYRYVGRHRLWRDAHHQLVGPSKLTIDQGKIVFLNEVQNVVQMLLLLDDIGLEDPPVFQLQPATGELYRENSALALFLLESICWELVCIGEDLEENYNGLEMIFEEPMPHDQAKQEVANMTRVLLGKESEDSAWQAYYGDRAVACLSVADEATTVCLWNANFEDE